MMNRHELQNAIRRVEGYYMPRPQEEALNHHEQAFERARKEVVGNLRAEAVRIETLTWEQFRSRGKSALHAFRQEDEL